MTAPVDLGSVEGLVLDIIYKLRGYVPTVSSSFTSIGVDSLVAVMFLRALSDRFGGYRIQASRVYGSGVSIRSFSKQLHEELALTHPEILIALHIPLTYISDNCITSDDNSFEKNVDLANDFDDLLSTNRLFLEGLRGMLTFIVLWDHFHVYIYTYTIHLS